MTIQPGMMTDPGQAELAKCGPLRTMPPVTAYFDTTRSVRFPKPDQLRVMLDSGLLGWFVPFCQWASAQLDIPIAGNANVLEYLSQHRHVPVTWMIPDFQKNVPLKMDSLPDLISKDAAEFALVRPLLTKMQAANVTPRGIFMNAESLTPKETGTAEENLVRARIWDARIDRLEALAGFQCAPEHSCVYGYRLPAWLDHQVYPQHLWFRLGLRRLMPLCVYPYYGDAGIDTAEKAFNQLGKFVADYAAHGVHNFNTTTSSGLGYKGELRLDAMVGWCRANYAMGTWKLWLYLGNGGAGNGIIAAMLALDSAQAFEQAIREGENWVPPYSQARGWYADPQKRTAWLGTDAKGTPLPADVWICCRLWSGLAGWFGVSSASKSGSVSVLSPTGQAVSVPFSARGEWTVTRLHGGAS